MPQQPDYENPEDYVLQGCGAYFMRFRSGKVIGVFEENVSGPDTLTYSQFKTEMLGCISPTGVATVPGSRETTVYPNPTSASVHIDAVVVISELQLLNGLGQVVFQSASNSAEIDLDMSAFAPGVYTLVLYHSGSQELSRHKLVRE
jgi:hypothetical protein